MAHIVERGIRFQMTPEPAKMTTAAQHYPCLFSLLCLCVCVCGGGRGGDKINYKAVVTDVPKNI